MRIRVLTLLGIWLTVGWSAEPQMLQYEASYLGIPLLDMTLTTSTTDSSVQISYDNRLKPLIAYFHPIHNVYRVEFCKESFRPLRWSRTIDEGRLKFELAGYLTTDGREARYSTGQVTVVPPNTFTVFSATHYLAAQAADEEVFPLKLNVLIDGELWQATATRYDARSPHPEISLGAHETLIQTDLHHLSGRSIVAENDILTAVIATENTRFLLWVQPDGSYSRAQFGSFPRAVVLQRKF